jgi:hypothetical protein
MNLRGHIPRPSVNTPAAQHPSQTYAVPATVISGELQELRSLAELTKARVGNLEALLEPPALAQITKTKRLMRDAHRTLERLQRRVSEPESFALVGDATVEAWQVYQRLVKIEEKLRRAVSDASSTDTIQSGAAPQATTGVERRSQHRRHSSGRVSFALYPRPTPEERTAAEEAIQSTSQRPVRIRSWLDAHEWEEDWRHLMAGVLPPAVLSAPPTPIDNEPQVSRFYGPSFAGRVAERTDAISTTAIVSGESSSEDISGLEAFPMPPGGLYSETGSGASAIVWIPASDDGLRSSYIETSRPALTRHEVERRCAREETLTTIGLCDPDGKRKGSMSGFHATHAILAGIDDPNHCLPGLRFIKIHELKRLKEWLMQKLHLRRSGEISRTESVLHLIFVLQEGWRLETLAVLFSRTPRQVYGSCHDVFDRILEMYSETFLEYHRPTCPHLWKIAYKFMDVAESRRWERYYHWKKQDVFSVLVTLNMYIGRYRQQGQVALDGPCQHWWRYFAPPEPNEWIKSRGLRCA